MLRYKYGNYHSYIISCPCHLAINASFLLTLQTRRDLFGRLDVLSPPAPEKDGREFPNRQNKVSYIS